MTGLNICSDIRRDYYTKKLKNLTRFANKVNMQVQKYRFFTSFACLGVNISCPIF